MQAQLSREVPALEALNPLNSEERVDFYTVSNIELNKVIFFLWKNGMGESRLYQTILYYEHSLYETWE